jgi:hypothetical protein
MKINTPNEAIASIKTRQDALSTISSLYGTFETEIGKEFLSGILEQHRTELLDWLPDNVLIDLAKLHMHEEWRGYPWK